MRTLLPREAFVIPEGYNVINPQQQSLYYGIPWIAVDAAMFLNEWLKGHETVLDLGLGGSTVFYAARSKKVVGIEVDKSKQWGPAMLKAVAEQELDNTELTFVMTEDEVLAEIAKLEPSSFDLISIDTYHPLSRESFFHAALSKLKPSGLIVMDNYSDSTLWHKLASLKPEALIKELSLSEHRVEDFNQPGWMGRGTRLIIPL